MKKLFIILLILLFAGPVFAAGQIVKFEWDRSAEPEITGYQLYRATSAEGPFVAQGAIVSQTTEGVTPSTEDMVPYISGTQYYYIVTARSETQESGYSNQVSMSPFKPPTLRVVLSVLVEVDP